MLVNIMNKSPFVLFFTTFLLTVSVLIGFISFTNRPTPVDDKILSYTVDPTHQDLRFYWKDDSSKIFRSILNLKNWLSTHNKTLVFAMNGGMYQQDNSPQGLFIQENKTITRLNTGAGNGNFHLKPNGVFYITNDKRGLICKTEDFKDNAKIRFATQSGPMLVIDGKIHSAFKQGSANLNIRNGVGILPDHKIIFAVSKDPINFYDFADYFISLGCLNALYLDGFVSRTYLPEKKWTQTDGNFGVIVGVSTEN
jgi:uncharacterized protein YigE (DUF2233 family)